MQITIYERDLDLDCAFPWRVLVCVPPSKAAPCPLSDFNRVWLGYPPCIPSTDNVSTSFEELKFLFSLELWV